MNFVEPSSRFLRFHVFLTILLLPVFCKTPGFALVEYRWSDLLPKMSLLETTSTFSFLFCDSRCLLCHFLFFFRRTHCFGAPFLGSTFTTVHIKRTSQKIKFQFHMLWLYALAYLVPGSSDVQSGHTWF